MKNTKENNTHSEPLSLVHDITLLLEVNQAHLFPIVREGLVLVTGHDIETFAR